MPLVPITEATHGVDIDLVYASDRNFTGRIIYRHPRCYLHRDTEACLLRAVDFAARLGFRLRLLDAFRPAEAQWMLWNHLPDTTYIADPRRGSPHSMGAAVDLTLIDATSGEEMDFGTGFDDMRNLSWHGAAGLSATVERNRALLLGLMTNAGFDFYRNEWWHYLVFSPRGRYPVLTDSVLAEGLM